MTRTTLVGLAPGLLAGGGCRFGFKVGWVGHVLNTTSVVSLGPSTVTRLVTGLALNQSFERCQQYIHAGRFDFTPWDDLAELAWRQASGPVHETACM